jgi:hypothetical protein
MFRTFGCHPAWHGGTDYSHALTQMIARNPFSASVMIGLIALMTSLVTRLVCFLVFVFFEVPLLRMVLVMRLVIPALPHTLLVILVF